MNKAIYLLVPLVILLCSALPNTLEINKDTPVWEVLQYFGEPAPNHVPNTSIKGYDVEAGKRITLEGVGESAQGQKAKLQSKHFVCTSCHNIEKEDPDLSNPNPDARLAFVAEKGLPFLQGTTLYGAVNRSSFYNDDYEKKYGNLVEPARNNLRESIQLCAEECSQGRRLKTWELESVLGYLWTLELKMGDLNLTKPDYESIQKADAPRKGTKNEAIVNTIKQHYSENAPAHFVDPPENRKQGSGLKGNPDNGQKIYELSCLHCHENERYSFLDLDNSKQTFRYLKRNFKKYNHASVYQVARYGTSPKPGKRAYMPLYPIEKMSEQQLADLRAYVWSAAR